MLNIQRWNQALCPFTGEALKMSINGTKKKREEGRRYQVPTPLFTVDKK
jgi:hypothetical protein